MRARWIQIKSFININKNDKAYPKTGKDRYIT